MTVCCLASQETLVLDGTDLIKSSRDLPARKRILYALYAWSQCLDCLNQSQGHQCLFSRLTKQKSWSRGILRCMSVGKDLRLIRQGVHAVKLTHADTLKKWMPIHGCIKAVARTAGNARSNNRYREGGQADNWIFYLDKQRWGFRHFRVWHCKLCWSGQSLKQQNDFNT